MQKIFYAAVLCTICISAVLTACRSERPASDVNRVMQPQAAEPAKKTADAPAVTDTPAAVPTAAAAPAPADTPSPTAAPKPPDIDYASVRPYEVGQIMIIMYHGLVQTEAEEDTYQRTVDNFRKDLQTFYDRGFRLISMKDWTENNITTAAGYTPLILTFDDGKPTSFSLESKDGKLQPVKDCAVDIMTKFSEAHPDFGNTAMFFINQNPFKGGGSVAERLQYLVNHGYEIGNHTMDHKQLPKLDADGIQAQIGGIDKLIKENIPGYEPYALSYPYGERPLKANFDYILNGVYAGAAYHYKIAVREGQSSPASAVNRVGFDPINVPRVRGSDNQNTDMGWTLRQYESNPELRYISDGNPGRIAVPEKFADNVDRDSLKGKELYIY